MECWRCRGMGHMGRDCATPYGKGPIGPKGGGKPKGGGGGKDNVSGKGKGKDWGKGKRGYGGYKGGGNNGILDLAWGSQAYREQWPVFLPNQQPNIPYGPECPNTASGPSASRSDGCAGTSAAKR